jgi:hypothetical protein
LSIWTFGDVAIFLPAEGGDSCGMNISGKSVACCGGLATGRCSLEQGTETCAGRWLVGAIGWEAVGACAARLSG